MWTGVRVLSPNRQVVAAGMAALLFEGWSKVTGLCSGKGMILVHVVGP